MTIKSGHPYGIQPWGNYLTQGNIKDLQVRAGGLGPLLSQLKDEILLDVLGGLSGSDLAKLSRCSRALYAFAHHQDIWKALTLTELARRHEEEEKKRKEAAAAATTTAAAINGTGGGAGGGAEGPRLRYQGTWKETYISIMSIPTAPLIKHHPIRVSGLYSDVLHAPYAAAKGIGRLRSQWLSRDNCPRLHHPSPETFRSQCEEVNRPCIITGVANQWPALQKWATAQLLEEVAGSDYCLHGGDLSFSIQEYAEYAASQHDDLPLYIFDSRFAEKSPALAADYVPYLPPYFQENSDLFSLLGEDGNQRPDHRWLIWGPKGSGSTFHKDPNATAAWNAVIRGKKKWILVPPHLTPPGVHPTKDGLDLATPVTLTEWFEGFYSTTTAMNDVIEAVCKQGEIMYVPRGWWHLVLNLEEAVAITQNYVSVAGLPHVLSFLDEQRHLISGLPQKKRNVLYERFVQVLESQAPEILHQAQENRLTAAAPSRKKQRTSSSSLKSWREVMRATTSKEGGEQERKEKDIISRKEEDKGKAESNAANARSTNSIAIAVLSSTSTPPAKEDDGAASEGGGGERSGFRFSFAL